jgi:hypothetical protein
VLLPRRELERRLKQFLHRERSENDAVAPAGADAGATAAGETPLR